MDVVSIVTITIPIIFPVIMAMGYDPVWFGVLVCINMELCAITPPVGLNLFVVQGMSGEKIGTVIRGVFPFIVLMLLALVTIGLFEPISTWLPSTMFR